MAEYIERKALIEKISKLEVAGAFTDIEVFKNVTLKIIFEEPTADVQEVVRCGQCKHHKLISRCVLHKVRMFNDDYCSYGQKRSEQK